MAIYARAASKALPSNKFKSRYWLDATRSGRWPGPCMEQLAVCKVTRPLFLWIGGCGLRDYHIYTPRSKSQLKLGYLINTFRFRTQKHASSAACIAQLHRTTSEKETWTGEKLTLNHCQTDIALRLGTSTVLYSVIAHRLQVYRLKFALIYTVKRV